MCICSDVTGVLLQIVLNGCFTASTNQNTREVLKRMQANEQKRNIGRPNKTLADVQV